MIPCGWYTIVLGLSTRFSNFPRNNRRHSHFTSQIFIPGLTQHLSNFASTYAVFLSRIPLYPLCIGERNSNVYARWRKTLLAALAIKMARLLFSLISCWFTHGGSARCKVLMHGATDQALVLMTPLYGSFCLAC
jgi:hypothetical protein